MSMCSARTPPGSETWPHCSSLPDGTGGELTVQRLSPASRRLNDIPRLGKNHSTYAYALCPWQVVLPNATTVAGRLTPPHATHQPGHTHTALPCPTAREPPQLRHFTFETRLVGSPP